MWKDRPRHDWASHGYKGFETAAVTPDFYDDGEEEAPKPKRGRPAKVKAEDEEELEEKAESDDDEEDDDFAPKKKAKAAKGFDDDEEEETENEDDEESEEEEDDEEEAPPAKKKKAAKVTADDVNDACKAKVKALTREGKSGADARKLVVKLLKKNFDVSSVTDLEPEQYAKAVKVMS